MTKTFENYSDLTVALVADCIARLPANVEATTGFSNVSCSAYVNAIIDVIDEDGDEVTESFKLRFSDHGDRYNSDWTVRFERKVTAIVDDEDGEFLAIEIDDDDFAGLVQEAVDAIAAWRAGLGEAV